MLPVLGTVLLVDDDAAVRAALKFALEVEGFQVQLYNGSRALLADTDLPGRACLVVDYDMPELDGLELVSALRHRNIMLPVILISAKLNKGVRALAKQGGISQVLEKPLSDAALVDGIHGALSAIA